MNGGTQTSALSARRKTVRVVRCGGQEVKKVRHMHNFPGNGNVPQAHAHLNLPIRLRCENISPPGTYSITI